MPKSGRLIGSVRKSGSGRERLAKEKLSVGGDDIHLHDRVLLTKRERKLGVENGFMGEVVSIDHEKDGLLIRLDRRGWPVSLRVEEYGAKNIKLGYASTVHKSQGQTVEHCHVLMGGHMTDLHLGYVQASLFSRIDPPVYRPVSCRAGPQRAIRRVPADRSKDLARENPQPCYSQAQEQEQALKQQQGITSDRKIAPCPLFCSDSPPLDSSPFFSPTSSSMPLAPITKHTPPLVLSACQATTSGMWTKAIFSILLRTPREFRAEFSATFTRGSTQ